MNNSSAKIRKQISLFASSLATVLGLAGAFGCEFLTDSKCYAAPRVVQVAADGNSDFYTIQSALDSLPVSGLDRVVIKIGNGVYNERVRINRNRVTLRGESRDGVQIRFHWPRSEYDRRYDALGPGVVNVFGNDVVIENLTIDNVQQSREHAFALYGQPDRFILRDCDVLGEGGDTVSLWNTAFGKYYHSNCRFRGGVDFVCPRGWCYVRDCVFECPTRSAAIWHDGHMDLDMKFVLRNCQFDGVKDFWLGRNHYPSQFYLLDCTFGENMADKPILTVKEPGPKDDPALYERKFFYNCHRTGGDYAWHADNLHSAPAAPQPEQINAAWTFDDTWNPETKQLPAIRSVEVDRDRIILFFSEPVAGVSHVRVVRSDGSHATYLRGNGTDQLTFRGGNSSASPAIIKLFGDEIYGTTASLGLRYLSSGKLPKPSPRQSKSILLIGDSTVTKYDEGHAYQGWGAVLDMLFDEHVTILNRARGGRSSKSFREEGHWDEAKKTEPDYVIIQFGHNDNPGKGPERYTDPAPRGEYRANLRRYVEESRTLGATPVLVSPPTRRFYDNNGRIKSDEGNVPYAEATLAVAAEMGCTVVDLNRLTRELFNLLGEAHSDWIQPVGDRTHFTPAGARRIASLVVRELITESPDLAQFIAADALNSTNSVPQVAATSPAQSYRPIAPLYWRLTNGEQNDPSEELLWPEGLPNRKEITRHVDDRGIDHRDRKVTGVREPTISIYPTSEAKAAVVICPGGGYSGLAIDKEGHDTARWLNSLGITAAVLKYRCREYGHPAPRDDVQRALAVMRSRADELAIDRNRIGVMGYSAGGHVASTAGTRFVDIEIDGKPVSSRPDFMILVYPVISMDPLITHQGSHVGLLGKHPSDELVKSYCNDLQVSDQTPPTFLVHASDDRAVPVENSLRMMRALQKAGVPVELALYEQGGHGFGLVSEPIAAAQWPDRCEQWLRSEGILDSDAQQLPFKMPEYPQDEPPPPRSQSEVKKLLAGAAVATNTKPLHVVLVAGPKDHGKGEHDYPNWQRVWSRLLREHAGTTVDTAWEFPKQEQIEAADVIVFYQRGRWNDERAAAMDPFLARGGGAVYIHWAVDGRGGEHEMAKRIGLASLGGSIGYRHGPLHVDFSHNPDHPVARNLATVDWVDESYWRLRGDPSQITLLGTGVEEGEPRPLFWTVERGRGRVFVSIPGHYMWTFDDPIFRTVLLRGIAWAGRRDVDRFNALVTLDARIR